MTKQQLIQQRDYFKTKLNEVQEQLNKFDTEVYGGKMAKAIKLLGECLDYLSYPTVKLRCPDCERASEFNLDEIIDGLQTLYREKFEKKWLITFENGYPGCTLEEEFEGTREEAEAYAEDSLEDFAQTWTHIAFGWGEEFTEEEYEDYRADCGYTIAPYEEEEEDE